MLMLVPDWQLCQGNHTCKLMGLVLYVGFGCNPLLSESVVGAMQLQAEMLDCSFD